MNLIAVILNKKSWMIIFKTCDISTVIISSYIFFVLPIQNSIRNKKYGDR